MSEPQALLVHGAWGGEGDWTLVRDRLDGLGVAGSAITLPSRESSPSAFEDDVARVRDALEALDGSAVLAGHSYAGMVITAASAANPRVSALVYVCALLPQRGDSAAALMRSDPRPSRIFSAVVPRPDGTTTLDPAGAKEFLYNDVDDATAAPYIAALGPQRMATFESAVVDLGWQEHPVTYVRTGRDLVLSPDLQRRMSARAATVVEVDAGHFPMLSKPAEVASAIAAASHAGAQATPEP